MNCQVHEVLIKAVQGSSETTLVTLALHCASYSQTGAAGIGTVTSVLRVLTQTQGCEHETVCLHVWQAVLIHSSNATEEQRCLQQVNRVDGCRRYLVLKGSGLLLAPLSQPIELLACLVQPRHPAWCIYSNSWCIYSNPWCIYSNPWCIYSKPSASPLCCCPSPQWHTWQHLSDRCCCHCQSKCSCCGQQSARKSSRCSAARLCSFPVCICRLVCRLCS